MSEGLFQFVLQTHFLSELIVSAGQISECDRKIWNCMFLHFVCFLLLLLFKSSYFLSPAFIQLNGHCLWNRRSSTVMNRSVQIMYVQHRRNSTFRINAAGLRLRVLLCILNSYIKSMETNYKSHLFFFFTMSAARNTMYYIYICNCTNKKLKYICLACMLDVGWLDGDYRQYFILLNGRK